MLVRGLVHASLRRVAHEVRAFLDKESRERAEKAAELAHARHGELSYELRRIADAALHIERALKEEGLRVERQVATGIDALVEHTALLARTVADVEASLLNGTRGELQASPEALFVPFVVEKLKGRRGMKILELSTRDSLLPATLGALGHEVRVRGGGALSGRGKRRAFDAVVGGFDLPRDELVSARPLLEPGGLLLSAGDGPRPPTLEGFAEVDWRAAKLGDGAAWLLLAKAV